MIPLKTFGRTGHQSTRTIFGAFALGNLSQDEANKVLKLLLKHGINHIDTAPSYGDSELRIGPWMEKHRNDFFLATKTEGRTYDDAMAELHQSHERLRVKQVDLWQMHNIINQEQWEIAMQPGGAIDALQEAKAKGLTKYIGITGHGLAAPKRHLESLKKYNFDTVLLPYNFVLMQNEQYAADFDELVKVCNERNVAIQTIKAIATGKRVEHENAHHNTWYKPLKNDEAIANAVHWVLGNENVFLNTAGDVQLMEKIFKAAAEFKTITSAETMLTDVERYNMTSLFTGDEI